jgi:hypothetical protein
VAKSPGDPGFPMSIRLTDATGQSLKVNAWNWGMLHYAVTCAKPPLFEDEAVVDGLRHGGAELDAGQARKLHDFLSSVIRPMIPIGQRMMFDFSTTTEPDDGTLFSDDLRKNYSLRYDVLVSVIDFLATAQAPVQVS